MTAVAVGGEKMGTVVFAHDHQFYQDGTGVLFSRGGQFGAALWGRYLEHCDRLRVVARAAPLSPLENPSQLSASSRDGVSFVPVPSLAGVGKQLSNRDKARDTVLDGLRDADLLIARLPSQTGLLAIEAAEQLGKPWAVECVGCAWDAYRHHGSLRARLYAPLAWWEMRRAIARAPAVRYVSERFLQHRYPTRGVSLSCSDVEIDDYAPLVLRQRLVRIASAGASRGPLRFGLMAPLHHQYKGVDVALGALSRVRQQLPAFELHLLGPGDPVPWQRRAEQLGIGSQLVIDGVLPAGAAVRQWLDAIDIYLQPSRQEGLPRAVIEAMSRGCPVLASTAGGLPELLPAGCLHPVGDADALAEQVCAAVDVSWQQHEAQRNHEAAARFAPTKLAAIRAQWYQRLLAISRSRPTPP
jgi:glycosyltransferase involved in cell wall biosynthesis